MATADNERPAESETADNQEPQSSPSKKRKSKLSELEVNLEAPEPPSKRARRALKKGKPLPAKPDSDDEKPMSKAKREEKENAEKAARSEHGVWIGNLRFNATREELRKWLVDNSGGVITEESMTRVYLPMTKPAGRDKQEKPSNKGFAYVDFKDLGAKVAAIALSETELGFRKLLIKDAKSFEGRPKKEDPEATDKTNGKSDEPTSRKIFIGNLGFKTTEDDVRTHFEKCGEIDWVKVATFEDTGKCKGFGWVKFREAEAAAQAVKGFVKIPEVIETEEDFVAPKAADGSEDDEPEEKEVKKIRMRKWWLNKLMGRALKLELAEDDQVRYKKRFKKDGPNKVDADGTKPDARKQDKGSEKERENKGRRNRSEPAPLKAQDDLMVARLTGSAAKHTGTKITFD